MGDVIVLDQGDNIPADGLYIEGFNCSADESNMTGESDAIAKNEKKPFMSIFSRFVPFFVFNLDIEKIVLIFFCCFLFSVSGSTIAEGSCHMLAMRVGSNSEWGKTLEQLQTGEEPETPLQKKLKKLAFLIGITSPCAFFIHFNFY